MSKTMTLYEVLKTIADELDWESVVRCKDCKRANTPRCPFYKAGWGYTDDDFCSCGERGEADDKTGSD